MHATYKNALMWTLYGVLFLLIAVLQTVVFGRARFFGVKLTLIPVCIACVSMLAGAEAGALYGLCCGTVWCFTGASGGALHIVLMTICFLLLPRIAGVTGIWLELPVAEALETLLLVYLLRSRRFAFA